MSPVLITRWLALLGLVVCSACSTTGRTEPARSATEMILISTAADRAIEKLGLDLPEGTDVALIDARFESYDQPYVISALEQHILQQGADVVADPETADVLVEIRSGGLSTNTDDFLIGIPALGLPVPGVGTVSTPELALFAKAKQEGQAKLALHARRKSDGELMATSGPVFGFAHHTDWRVLMIPFSTDDILPKEK